MRQIELTKGKIALVDDEDFSELNKHKWCAGKIKDIWYAYRGKREGKTVKRISMHRVIMKATKRWDIVDHINHDGLDNRRSNLRIVTHAENIRHVNPQKIILRKEQQVAKRAVAMEIAKKRVKKNKAKIYYSLKYKRHIEEKQKTY